MNELASANDRLNASGWLRASPVVVESIRQRLDGAGRPPADALLHDPTLLAELFKDAVIEALRRDAPIGVAEELLASSRLIAAGARRFDRDGYVGRQLAALQGLRDRSELLPPLRASVANAPDPDSRATLQRLVDIVYAMPAELVHTEPGALPDVVEGGVPTETEFTGTIVVPPPAGPDETGGEPGTDGSTGAPGTGEPGGGEPTDTGTEPTTKGVAAELGALIGAELGEHFDIPGAIEIGEQLGSDFADAPDPEDMDGYVSLGGRLGALIGAKLAEVAGLVTSAVAGLAVQLGTVIGQAFGISVLGGPNTDGRIDVVGEAACVLCGPPCLLCVVTAETIITPGLGRSPVQ